MNSDRIYFQNLDIVRFFAAYMIVLFHLFYGWKANYGFPSFMTDEKGELTFLGKHFEIGFHNLSLGVDIFFLISGFLITFLLLQEKEKSGKVNILKFYFRRVLRIWPLYFLILLLGPILTYFYNEPQPGSYIPHLFFVGNFELISNGFSSVAVNHLWSICIEEHFYILCPLIVAFVPNRKLPAVLFSIIFCSILYRGYISGTENYWMKMYMNTASRIDVLSIGCYAGYLYYRNKLSFTATSQLRWIIYAVFLYMYFTDIIVDWDNFFFATVKKYFYVLMSGYIVGNFLFNPSVKIAPKKPNFLHYLGKVSYGIYMFNPIGVALVIKTFNANQYHNLPIYFLVVNLLVLLAVSISYRFYEKPFLKLKDKFAVIKSREKPK